MNVFVLGVGTEKGGRIPVSGNEYLRDSDGYVVVTKLNEEMARSIAEAGKGVYITVDNTNNAQTIIDNELDKLAKDDIKTEVYTKYREQFMAIAAIVFILLVCEIVLNVILEAVSISRRKKNRS
jgi:Ca-activated chloride channel family protein